MLSSKKLSELYSISESLQKKGLLHQLFSHCQGDRYVWSNSLIETIINGKIIHLKLPILDLHTFDDNIDSAFLNLIDQIISLYEEYLDDFDSDSKEIRELIESFLYDLDAKYQPRLNNTMVKSTSSVGYSSPSQYKPTYVGI